MDEFLLPAICEAARISKLVLINIANSGGYPIADDVKNTLVSKGLLVNEEEILFPKIGGGQRGEPLLAVKRKRQEDRAEEIRHIMP